MSDSREEELTLILGNVEREHFGVPPLMKITGEGWELARKLARAALAFADRATGSVGGSRE